MPIKPLTYGLLLTQKVTDPATSFSAADARATAVALASLAREKDQLTTVLANKARLLAGQTEVP